MGTPLGPKYIPYTYMDPLGLVKRPLKELKGIEEALFSVFRFWFVAQSRPFPKGPCSYIVYT